MVEYFATFGSSQLEFSNLNPMKTAVTIEGATEEELRQKLREHPFNNKYCTTYPMEKFEAMNKEWGVEMYNLYDV